MNNDRIVYVEAGGRKLPLCYNLGACVEIARKLGSTTAIFDLFSGAMSEEEKRIREEISGKTETAEKPDLVAVLPFLVACLARNGQKRLGATDEPITEEWVNANVYPSDVSELTFAVCQALSAGLDMEHGTGQDAEVDVVQEEIEKN